MAKIRIAVEFNRGRSRASLSRFGSLCSDLNKFLVSAAKDVGIDIGEFSAFDFTNRSVAFKAESPDIEDAKAAKYRGEIRELIAYEPSKGTWKGVLTGRSLKSYSTISEHMELDDTLEIALLDSANEDQWDSFSWLQIKKRHAEAIAEFISEPISYYGSVFGKIHSLFKEGDEPHFTLRESVSNRLVACHYRNEDYATIYDLLKERDAHVHVAGIIVFSREMNEIESIDCERMKRVSELSDEQTRGVLQELGNVTGALTTEDFIKKIRDDR